MRDGPGIDRAPRLAPSRAPPAFCKIVALSSVGWRRRFPRWSDWAARPMRAQGERRRSHNGYMRARPARPSRENEAMHTASGAAFADGATCDVLPEPELVGVHCRGCGRRVHGARHGGEEKIGAGRLDDGAARAMRPERAGDERQSRAMPARAQVHGPGRGDREPGRGAGEPRTTAMERPDRAVEAEMMMALG